MKAFGNTTVLGPLPWLLVPTILAAVAMWYLLNRLRIGRLILAIGGNAHAAELSGISPPQTIVWAHALSGLLAAIAGIMVVARLQIGQPSIGDDWLILSFAAPVIGGAVLTGGHVSVAGTFLGVVIVAIITQSLVLFADRPVRRADRARQPDPAGGGPEPSARGPRRAGVGADLSMAGPVLEARGIGKSFPGVVALADVALELGAGSIHALLGENGAGKSTLIKILTGIHQADAGELLLDGRPVRFADPREAIAAGIGVVHQERNLIPRFSVGENIMLERLGPSALSRVDYAKRAGRGAALAGPAGPRRRPCAAGLAAQRREDAAGRDRQGAGPALARAADGRADRVADPARDRHPVRAAAPPARRGCHHRLRQPQARGGAGDLRPCHGPARRPQRLRQPAAGRHGAAGSGPPDDRPQRADPRLERTRDRDRCRAGPGAARRRARALGHAGIDLTLRRGEIVGLYGLVGAGRSELAKAILGLFPLTAGEIRSTGRPVAIGSVADALHRHGIGYVSEDRKQEGLILLHTVLGNAGITIWSRLASALGFLRDRTIRTAVEPVLRQLEVRTPSLAQTVGNLSGGNQQKISVAKWLAAGVRILIVDEPTVGIDIKTKVYLHELLRALADQGTDHPADHQRHARDDHAGRPDRRDGRLPDQGRHPQRPGLRPGQRADHGSDPCTRVSEGRVGEMKYRQLGRSGLRVSVLTLGTMTFGGSGVFAKTGDTDIAGAQALGRHGPGGRDQPAGHGRHLLLGPVGGNSRRGACAAGASACLSPPRRA